jgi:hypothetical protein
MKFSLCLRDPAHSGAGDLTLFADVGGACYVAYDSWSTEHKLAIKHRLCLPVTAYTTSHSASAAISSTRQVVQLSFTRITSARTLVHLADGADLNPKVKAATATAAFARSSLL